MRVFISWSGKVSSGVASALKSWLELVHQQTVCFVSTSDIAAGVRWHSSIASELQEANFGIICVTRANQHERWLNFEAGALSKSVDSSRVVPLAIDLPTAEISGPLAQFQGQPL